MARNRSPGLQQTAHNVYICALSQVHARNVLDGGCVLSVHVELVSLGIRCLSGGLLLAWLGQRSLGQGCMVIPHLVVGKAEHVRTFQAGVVAGLASLRPLPWDYTAPIPSNLCLCSLDFILTCDSRDEGKTLPSLLPWSFYSH